jgi:Phage portal protein, SPP1 Gp6-like
MTQTLIAPAQTQQAQPQYKITEADKKQKQRIVEAWQAYDGELTPPLKKTEEGIDPNVMSNRCQPIVEAGVNFLFGDELEISLEEDTSQDVNAASGEKSKKTSPEQDFINQVWGDKETRIPLLQDLAMNGAMAGKAFLRIVPTDETFRLVVIDPSTVYVQTAPQDCETITLYCIQYSQIETIDGRPAQVFYREEMAAQLPPAEFGQLASNLPTSWTIQHWTQVGAMNMAPQNGRWVPAGPPIDWPYPFAPLFGCKNLPRPNDAWGKPDITQDIIGMNKALNVLQSCTQQVQILYGYPFLFASGMGEGTIKYQPGTIMLLPEGVKLEAVAIHSDVANSIAFADEIRSDLDEQTGVPGVAVGRVKAMPRGQMSGIAIELFFMSLVKKSDKKRCLYGKLIIDVSSALLVLNKMMAKMGDVKIMLAWQDALPHDDLDAVAAAVQKMQVGVSKSTLQRELGYDPENELQLSQAEDELRVQQQLQEQQAMMQAQGVQPGQPPQPESPFMARGQQ